MCACEGGYHGACKGVLQPRHAGWASSVSSELLLNCWGLGGDAGAEVEGGDRGLLSNRGQPGGLLVLWPQGVSVGYNCSGKKAGASRFEPYGAAFGPGDRVTVLVDLTGGVGG